MNDHLDQLDERISRHLRDQTRLVDVGAPSMVHVSRRAHQRRNRRRTAFGVAGTAAVSAATIFGIQALSRPHTSRLVPTQPAQPSPGSGFEPAIAVPSNLTWNRFEPDSAKAIVYASTRVAVDGGFLAWSTQPGRSNVPTQVLYRSNDGIVWEQIPGASPDQPASLTAAGDRLYSFGTSPATAAGLVGKATVGVSTDDAVTWRQLDLPVDLGDLSGLGANVQAAISPVAFAAGDHGAIAVVSVTPRLTAAAPAELRGSTFTVDGITLPDRCVSVGTASTMVEAATSTTMSPATTMPGPGALGPTTSVGPGSHPDTAASTSTTTTSAPATMVPGAGAPAVTVAPGVAPMPAAGAESEYATTTTSWSAPAAEMPACTADTTGAQTRTWADLGVDPATAAIFAEPAQVFVATDGEQFVPVGTLPLVPTGYRGSGATAIATTEGYAVLRSSYNDTASSQLFELLTSPDGATWSSTQLPTGSTSTFGQLADGSIAVLGSSTSGPIVMVVRDGTVRTVSLAGLVTPEDGPNAMIQSYPVADIGGAGATVLVSVFDDRVKAAGQPSTTRDGVTLTLLDEQGGKRFTDAATGADLGVPPQSFDQVTGMPTWTVTADDGSVVAFTQDDVNALYPASARSPFVSQRMIILHSDDGIAWSRDDFEALSGIDQIGDVNVMSTGNQVIVSAVDAPAGIRDPDDPLPPTVVLVGTPTT